MTPPSSRRARLLQSGDALLIPALASFAVLYSLLLGAFIPWYPNLLLRYDQGGALGVPHFAENPTRRASLFTWAFNRYAVVPSGRDGRAFELDVDIGDYVVVTLANHVGQEAGVRLSVDPRRPSELVRFNGGEIVETAPLATPVLERGVVHRMTGWHDDRELRLAVDGETYSIAAPEGGDRQWLVLAGISSSEFVRYAVGPSPDNLQEHRPWDVKRYVVALMAVLIFLHFFLLLWGTAPRGRWIAGGLFLLGAAGLYRPSFGMAVVAVFTPLAAMAAPWVLAWYRRRTRQRRGSFIFAALLSGNFAFLLASFFILQVLFDRLSFLYTVATETMVQCEAPFAPPVEGAEWKRVVVYGTSTAFGQGLFDPEADAFPGLLDTMLNGVADVTLRGRHGGTLKDFVKLQETAPDVGADLVVLFATFNDAMFADDSLFRTILAGRVFDVYKYSYDSSRYMSNNYGHYRDLYETRLREFIRNAGNGGAKVLIVGEPCADQIVFPRTDHGVDLLYQSYQRIADEENASFIDISGELAARSDETFFIDAIHLDAWGHCLLARALYPSILRLIADSGDAS